MPVQLCEDFHPLEIANKEDASAGRAEASLGKWGGAGKNWRPIICVFLEACENPISASLIGLGHAMDL